LFIVARDPLAGLKTPLKNHTRNAMGIPGALELTTSGLSGDLIPIAGFFAGCFRYGGQFRNGVRASDWSS
jgi:hypothetical protein